MNEFSLPETNSLPLKINGWKMNFLFGSLLGWSMFRGYANFREGISVKEVVFFESPLTLQSTCLLVNWKCTCKCLFIFLGGGFKYFLWRGYLFWNFSCFFLVFFLFFWLWAFGFLAFGFLAFGFLVFWLLASVGFWLLASVGLWPLLAFGFWASVGFWLLASVGLWLLSSVGFCWLLAFGFCWLPFWPLLAYWCWLLLLLLLLSRYMHTSLMGVVLTSPYIPTSTLWLKE